MQILEVNGQTFENVQLSKAIEILKNNIQLCMSVKTNLLGEIPSRIHPQHTRTAEFNISEWFFFLSLLIFTLLSLQGVGGQGGRGKEKRRSSSSKDW